jgi:hypothetical protein
MKKVEGLLQQLTLTSNKTDIEKIAKQLGGIDNEFTLEAVRDLLNNHFQNTIVAKASAEVASLKAQKSMDQERYKKALEAIVSGAAAPPASTDESKSEESGFIDINDNNRIWILRLITLFKGLYQRSVHNGYSILSDPPTQAASGFTRLQIAEFSEKAAEKLLSRLTAAPALAPVTNTVTVTQEEKTTEEHPVTNLLAGMEQKIQQLKTKITANEQPLDVTDLLKDTLQLKEELGKQHLAFYNQNTQATLECKQHESDLENLSAGEIPDDLLAKVETEKDEKLQPLVAAYQSGRSGSYFSPTAWSNWYSLNATKKNLNEALQVSVQSKISSAQGEIKESTQAMRGCESLIYTTTSFEQNLKKLENYQVTAAFTKDCIKHLEADIAKLNSGWVKVKCFVTGKSSERKKRIEQRIHDKSKLFAAQERLAAKLSDCNFALLNSANPPLLKKSENELAPQSARPAA